MSHPVPGHDYSEQNNKETDKGYEKRRDLSIKKAVAKRMGKERVKYEKEANPDLPSAKKAIRRKGFSSGKAFHLALEQTRRHK